MNELINLLPYLGAIFICTIFLNLCYAELNDHKLFVNPENIIIIFVTSILTVVNNMYINYALKTLFTLIIVNLDYKLIFKDDIKRTIISYILIASVLILLEIAVTNIMAINGFLNATDATFPLSIVKICLSIGVGLLELILFKIRLIQKILKKSLKVFNDYVNINNVLYLIFLVVAVLGILNVKNFSNNDSTNLMITLIFIFGLLFTLIIKSKTNEEILKKTNKKLIEFNEKYGKFLDEYKIYKHNINHKLAAMKSYGNKKINALIDELLDEETTFTIKNNNLYAIPNGIKGIVAEKLYDINFDVLIHNNIKKDPFANLSPKAFNSISECLGIALDNAIEASKETSEPVIVMDLYEDEENIFVKIGNNFCNDIDIDKLGDKYYSTKNRGSGLGLYSVVQNKLVKERISIINNFYYIELKIKKAR